MALPYELMIGLRYTRAKRRNHFISFISLTSMLGLALGVLAMIVVLSVMNGFQQEMSKRILGTLAHASVSQHAGIADWQALADPQATLAVYMGKAAARTLSERLIAAGLAGDTPVALVENASRPGERSFRTRLDLLPLAAKTALGDGPALLLIGRAVGHAGLEAAPATAKQSRLTA